MCEHRARRTPLLAAVAAGCLAAVKALGAWLTGSLALVSAALDSVVDLVLSAANYVVVRKSAEPPDEEHAWGHGKFENLASLLQGLILAAAGVGLVAAAVDRLLEGGAPEHTGVGVAILALSLGVGLWVSRHLSRAAAEIDSPALAADSAHYRTDIWVNGGALVALLVVRWTGWWPADPLVAILVAAGVFRTSWRLILDAVQVLTDRALPQEETQVIRRVVASFAPEVLGFHDLRTRRSGPHRFIEMHLEIPRETTFERAHDLIVRVMRTIERELPRSKVTIHGDPVATDPVATDSAATDPVATDPTAARGPHRPGSGSM